MRDDEATIALFGIGLGGLASLGVALALVPLRSALSPADIALALVTTVVLASTIGGRMAGASAAVVSALSFDFFFTRPYLRLRIASRQDVVTTILLLVVGIAVGRLASRERRALSTAGSLDRDIHRMHRIAEASASGQHRDDIVSAATAELTELLQLRSCRFERGPAAHLPGIASGSSQGSHHRWTPNGFELPREGAEIPVIAHGAEVGRFVLEPTPGAGVSPHERLVAITIADQVGAVMAGAG